MIAEAVPVDASLYTAQYELLRSQVIGARCEVARPDAVCEPRGVGLALLLRDGVPGWLKAVETVIRASAVVHTPDAMASALSQHSAEYTCAPAWLSGVPRGDLATLLASLVLSTRPVGCSSPREEHRSWH